jgi:hypothetical protein
VRAYFQLARQLRDDIPSLRRRGSLDGLRERLLHGVDTA